MIDLGTWLFMHGNRRREAGSWDCCTMPAQWVIDNGLPDPMARWRGAYSSEDEAQALIEEAGGLATLFAVGMADIGVPVRSGKVQAGDIGVLDIGGADAGAIFTGKRWGVVAGRGLAFSSVESGAISAAWSING